MDESRFCISVIEVGIRVRKRSDERLIEATFVVNSIYPYNATANRHPIQDVNLLPRSAELKDVLYLNHD